jgi:branched-chain amino acid transport system permease protein
MGYFLTVFTAFASMVIVGIGLHLLMSLGGVLFLAIPAVVQIAAYAYVLMVEAGVSMGLALAFSLILTLLTMGVFMLLYRRLSEDSFMVLTLASMLGVESLISSWTSITNGVLGIGGISRPALFNSLEGYTLLTVILLLFFILLEFCWIHSKKGRYLRATKEHPRALQSLGISPQSIVSQTMLIAGAAFAVGAWLYVWKFRFLVPTSSGMPLLIQCLTIAILASKAKVRSVVLASAIVIFVPEVFRFLNLPPETLGYFRNLFYAIFLVVLVLKYHDKLSISNRKI